MWRMYLSFNKVARRRTLLCKKVLRLCKETPNFHYKKHSHYGMRFLGSDKLWFSMKLRFLLRIYCNTCTKVIASFFPPKPPFLMNYCKYFWTILEVTGMPYRDDVLLYKCVY